MTSGAAPHHLTTSGHRADRGQAVVFRDGGKPTTGTRRCTIFYDCVQTCEVNSDPHTVRYTGPWAVDDEEEDDGNFNESASVESGASPLKVATGGVQYISRTAEEDSFPKVFEEYHRKDISSSEGLIHQTCDKHKGRSVKEKVKNCFKSDDLIGIHSLEQRRCDRLAVQESATSASQIRCNNQPRVVFYDAESATANWPFEMNKQTDLNVEFFREVIIPIHKSSSECSVLIPKKSVGWESSEEWKSPFVNEGWELRNDRDETLTSSGLKEDLDRLPHWLDLDGHLSMSDVVPGEAKDELGLNSNTNAEEHVRTQDDEEYIEAKLTDPKLISKVRQLRKDRESLMFLVNLLLTWSLIQMLVLFGTLFYAFLCVCSFRQAFGCGEACLLKPRPVRGKNVKRRWWQT